MRHDFRPEKMEQITAQQLEEIKEERDKAAPLPQVSVEGECLVCSQLPIPALLLVALQAPPLPNQL